MADKDDDQRSTEGPETAETPEAPEISEPAEIAPPPQPIPWSFFEGPMFRGILIGAGAVFLLLMVFWAGMFVGQVKTLHGLRMSQQMGGPGGGMLTPGPRGGPMGPMGHMGGDKRMLFMGGHSAAGIVQKVDSDELIVLGPDEVQRTVSIGKKTQITRGKDRIKASEIKKGERVLVIGKPSKDGKVEARIIKVGEVKGKVFERHMDKGQMDGPPGMSPDSRPMDPGVGMGW